MKKAIWTIIILIVLAIGAFAYVTRPVAAPTGNINDALGKLPAGSATSSVYRISQADSAATFQMNEMLNGKPKLVIGTTTQVAGDIIIDAGGVRFDNLRLDARTLATDNSNRNGAIQRLILKTGTAGNEYIVFKPLAGYAGEIAADTPVSFDLAGDLTISGVTKPATFHITLTMTDSRVTGTGTTTIKRSDFGLTIPNIPFVANVDDQFPVKVDIVADRIMQ
jgi:polyisoprenoid-binding protein YceI